MALLRRELYRQVKGPEVTQADRCTLVFDTDAKNLYIEREVAHFDASADGTIEIHTVTMDIADYLKQGGQTAGHRELWRLLRTLFKEDSAFNKLKGQGQWPAARQYTPANLSAQIATSSAAMLYPLAEVVVILSTLASWV
jgi:hypothetical protein